MSQMMRVGQKADVVWRRVPTLLVAAGVATYALAFGLRSVANYRSYRMLFDMAVFEQSFWNGSRGRFFQTSLEIAGNHFATHFSPIFFLIQPIYNLKPSPPTLLVLQSMALGAAALPLYAIARRVLANDWLAVAVALCYLLTPAIMDINIVNDWHEIAFVVPCLMTAYYAALRIKAVTPQPKNLTPQPPSLRGKGESEDGQNDRFGDALPQTVWRGRLGTVGRYGLYAAAVGLALMTKEDQGFTVAVFGLWVALWCRQWRLGLATVAAALLYTWLAIGVFVPIYRGGAAYVPVNAYPELGTTLPEIIGHSIGDPARLWGLLTWPDKRGYVEWLLLPLGFLALLAPDVLVVALPALFITIAASNPAFFTIFERYTAPLVPTLFVAAVVGIGRLGVVAGWVGRRTRVSILPRYGLLLGVAILALATVNAQTVLKRIPTDFAATPDAHAQRAMTIIAKIPPDASFAPADNRALVFGADRRRLTYLTYDTMLYDYVLFDDSLPPITPTPPGTLADIKTILLRKYAVVYQEDGLLLLADKKAYQRDHVYWGR